MAELAQLALDAPMAPARVLPRQPEDEGLDLGRDGRAAAGVPPPECPLAPDQLAVPAQDRLGLEEEHIAVELVPRADGQPRERGGQDGQGQPLPAREAGRAGALALQQAHLVPQHEDLEVLVAVAPPRADHQVNEECGEVCEHEPEHASPPDCASPAGGTWHRATEIIADRGSQ